MCVEVDAPNLHMNLWNTVLATAIAFFWLGIANAFIRLEKQSSITKIYRFSRAVVGSGLMISSATHSIGCPQRLVQSGSLGVVPGDFVERTG